MEQADGSFHFSIPKRRILIQLSCPECPFTHHPVTLFVGVCQQACAHLLLLSKIQAHVHQRSHVLRRPHQQTLTRVSPERGRRGRGVYGRNLLVHLLLRR